MSYSSTELIRRYKISPDTIIHVGAWKGLNVPEYKKLGMPKIVLVEAMPDIASALREKYKHDSQVTVIEAAASDANKKVVKFYPLDYGSSSLLRPNIEKLQHFFRDFKELEPITVQTIKIDDLDSCNSNKVMLIIDVQGAELQVLHGSIKTLGGTVLVKVEVSTTTYYEEQSLQNEVELFLKTAGFRKVSQRVSKKMGQGDVIFVKNGHASIFSIIVGRAMDLRWRLSINDLNLSIIGSFWRKVKPNKLFRIKTFFL